MLGTGSTISALGIASDNTLAMTGEVVFLQMRISSGFRFAT
ncbi:MAG: hypothetical protein JETT_2192 [Candidatus Jettenia ecosi]|uniref:Uncharacterized protein n=1 Tax=Candidatus Jettenia ecosi TaxID=2494326 RepID=A0A533QAZ1_9BACT|nr:MAG: hypothetical protein JETT_2192 [Candidatus Jettenia ecosi]